MAGYPEEGLQLFSNISREGQVHVSIEPIPVRSPEKDEVVVRIDAAPINPSDLGLLFGAVNIDTIRRVSDNAICADFPEAALTRMKARLDKPLTVGNEGAGLVVDAGVDFRYLVGKTVALWGGAMYGQYRTIRASECLVLPEGVTAAEGAAAFINPLTVLGMMETARREGHRAIVHTAAASNLGQMLNRLCLKEGVDLVNIVRSDAHVALLKAAGARFVLNSTTPDFETQLQPALRETGATLTFDAIGGTIPGIMLTAMERSQAGAGDIYSHYGSPVSKQVYVYGVLDPGPITMPRTMGSAWSVGGWLLFHFLDRIGPEAVEKLKEQVCRELKGVFASHFDMMISLKDMLEPDIIRGYYARSTGRKYLVEPQRQ